MAVGECLLLLGQNGNPGFGVAAMGAVSVQKTFGFELRAGEYRAVSGPLCP
tara:strand:- start:6646 stop:6798 length:153 start_codon:yes stop_codon:yes gene_type:complete